MTVNYQQTDTAANSSAIAILCSNADGVLTNAKGNTCESGAAAGSTERTIEITPSEDNDIGWVWEIDATGYDGAAGDWTWRLNCTTSEHNIRVEDIHICRVNSSYVNQETLGSDTGHTATNPGNISGTINQASATTINAGDKIIITFIINDIDSMMNATVGITPDQIIVAPGTLTVDNSDVEAGASQLISVRHPIFVPTGVIGY